MHKTARALALTAPLLGLALLAPPAGAAPKGAPAPVVADLDPIQAKTGGDGEAVVEFGRNGKLSGFHLSATGLLANAPHAAHIHFGEQARHECPTLADDLDGDGLSTSEGAPAYGPVVVSLTTRGDTSPASVLAIDRYSTAPGGVIDYGRNGRIQTSPEVAAAIAAGEAVVVVHGVDYDGNGTYNKRNDGDVSDLTASLPREATDPALCGVLEQTHQH